MGLICRWKAPWVRLIVSFFAEGCLKRPWWGTLACSASGGLVKMHSLVGCNGWTASPASHHNELATEGVRADRVGAKPPL
jgi:hypothetical protein